MNGNTGTKDVKICIHADDLGINKEITDNIMDCINKGMVRSTSIVCNTGSFDYAMAKYKTNLPQCRLRLHINMVEGYPVTSGEEIPLLLNNKGEFKYDFFKLWMNYTFSFRKTKIELRKQIKTEILNQIRKFRSAIGSKVKIGIDSHTHIHMIPFVLNTILELSETEPITFIRLPKERFYLSTMDIGNYCSLNIIKNVLLNLLCITQLSKIKIRNIKTNNYFIGVMATGRMTISSVRAALNKLKREKQVNFIEILFHPGGVTNKNTIDWTNKNAFKDYYCSINRKREATILKGVTLEKIINRYTNYEDISDH